MIENSIVTFIFNFLLMCSFPFVWWLIFHRKKENFFKFVGLRKPSLTVPVWGLAVFFAAYLLFYFFGGDLLVMLVGGGVSGSAPDNGNTGPGAAAIAAAIITGLLANGFCEELLFRGFVLKRFKARIGATGAIIVAAVLFAVVHNVLWFFTGNTEFSYHVIVFVTALVSGLFFGFANEKMFGGSIWPSILMHGIGNALSNILKAYS